MRRVKCARAGADTVLSLKNVGVAWSVERFLRGWSLTPCPQATLTGD